MQDQRQQLIDRINQSQYVLVTVSKNPSVDQLAAAIGLTLIINKLNKHGTAVFSGAIPDTLDFLRPEDTLEKNTDSLRDFIIALDKSKADKLRYKVEDQMVRIFITPYRTSISEKDLNYQQGDFNVDMVIALGVHSQTDIDEAIQSQGSIMHDATVTSIALDEGNELGSINWTDTSVSSLCEMITNFAGQLGQDLIDGQIATSLLTGIVATTERFSNNRTTPHTMTTSALLMSSGANQQLIASELSAGKNLTSELNVVDSTGAEDMVSDDHKEPKTIEISHDLLAAPGEKEQSAVETPEQNEDQQPEIASPPAQPDTTNTKAPEEEHDVAADSASPSSNPSDLSPESGATMPPKAADDTSESSDFSDKLLDSQLLNPAEGKDDDKSHHAANGGHIMTHKELVLPPPAPSTDDAPGDPTPAPGVVINEPMSASLGPTEEATASGEGKVFVSAVDDPQSQPDLVPVQPLEAAHDNTADNSTSPGDTAHSSAVEDTHAEYMSLEHEPEEAVLPPLDLPSFEPLNSEPPEKPFWQSPQAAKPAVPVTQSPPQPTAATPLVTDVFRPTAEQKPALPPVKPTSAVLSSPSSPGGAEPSPEESISSDTSVGAAGALDSARNAVASALEGAVPTVPPSAESQPYQPASPADQDTTPQAVVYTPPPQPQHHAAPVGSVGTSPPASPPPIFPA